MDSNPRDDQADARLRDLTRLIELTRPHMRDRTEPIADTLPRMNPADRAEVQAILDRLGDIAEDPERIRERQKMHLHLAQLETELRSILAEGVPRWRNGKIVRDSQTGQPLRNLNSDRSMRATLRRHERLRSQITGLPPTGDDQG